MSDSHLLTLSQCQSSITFSSEVSTLLGIPKTQVKNYIAHTFTTQQLKQYVYEFVIHSLRTNIASPTIPTLYIYLSINSTVDNNGNVHHQETLPNVFDSLIDTVNEGVFNSCSMDRPLIVWFSDKCFQNLCKEQDCQDYEIHYFDWVLYAISDPPAHADDNILSFSLLNVLDAHKQSIHDLTSLQVHTLLNTELKSTLTGAYTSNLRVSDSYMMNVKLFPN
jgi:hypothetical protein